MGRRPLNLRARAPSGPPHVAPARPQVSPASRSPGLPTTVLVPPSRPLLLQLPHDHHHAVAAQRGRGSGVQRLRPLHKAARGERGGGRRGVGGREGQSVFPTWPPRTAGAAPALFQSGPLRLSLGQGLAPWCGGCHPQSPARPYSSVGAGPGPAPACPAWRKGPRQGQLQLPRRGSAPGVG